jgi:hypothetical protein
MYLSHQLSKDPFGPIASNRVSKSLPHDDARATRSIIHLVRQEIEQGGRQSATMMFDDLDVPVAAQKNDISSLRFRCHWERGCFFAAFHPLHDPGEDSSWWVNARSTATREIESDPRNIC